MLIESIIIGGIGLILAESRNPQRRIESIAQDYQKGKISGQEAQSKINAIYGQMIEQDIALQPDIFPRNIDPEVKTFFESGKGLSDIDELRRKGQIDERTADYMRYVYRYGGDSWQLSKEGRRKEYE